MELRHEIIKNWETDIIGYAHSVRMLSDCDYPCWTVKYPDSYGVAIPYEGAEEINELFSSAQIKSDNIPLNSGLPQRVLLLLADNSVSPLLFSALCEELVYPGEDGKNRKAVTESPALWWREWKDLLGNKSIDSRVYDTLGELHVLKYLIAKGTDASWGGPDASTYDIETVEEYVEVKSTTSRSTKEITVSSQFQMDTHDKKLCLVLCVFEESQYNGCSVDQIVNDLIRLGISCEYLNDRLAKVGLEVGMSARKRKFILHSMLKYIVDDSFPRITPESFVGGVIPKNIIKITYTVNLNGMESETLI